MLELKLRAGLLGLIVTLLVGMVTAGSASAFLGPYCYHRAIGGQGKGSKISAQTPEPFLGGGGTQTIRGKLALTEVEISAIQVQVKGIYYNTRPQCQFKQRIQFHFPALVKPEIKGCVVKVGKENEFEVQGHEGYTWNGTKEQLLEQPQQHQHVDWIVTPGPLSETAKELPKETFTEITLSSCGILSGTFPIKGTATAARTPENLGEWGTTETTKYTKGEAGQHWWVFLNETKEEGEFVGATTGLTFGSEPASYVGEIKIEAIKRQQNPIQEIVQWEQ